MRIRLIRRETIEGYVEEHASGRNSFGLWLSVLKRADWSEPGDIQGTFGSADLLGNGTNRVVFNIGGNSHRMICNYHFGATKVHLYIMWIGTHAEYTKICAENKQYSVDNYK